MAPKPYVINPELSDPLIWHNRIKPNINRCKMIEDYIANGLSIRECSVKHHIVYSTCCKIIECYFLKPTTNLTLSSKV